MEWLTELWFSTPQWFQVSVYSLIKIVAILLPLILAVAYFTFAER